jgi:hypothetical protein
MQLRAHPWMSYRGVSNRPPAWKRISGQGDGPVGEAGILEEAHLSHVSGNNCILVIRYDGSRYIGSLMFDDGQFCTKVCDFLSRHCGQPLTVVAGLDMGF